MERIQREYEGISVGSYPWFKPGNFGTAVVVSGLDALIAAQAANDIAAAATELGIAAHIVMPGDTA